MKIMMMKMVELNLYLRQKIRDSLAKIFKSLIRVWMIFVIKTKNQKNKN